MAMIASGFIPNTSDRQEMLDVSTLLKQAEREGKKKREGITGSTKERPNSQDNNTGERRPEMK